ncbi:CCAAT/enhancer-binding protein alpha-like isoform X2 [Macrobrachium nipponense]|uniref:CCAAT/enhancer-binding protein alpha-like isoform X2 n=1 Tax=Macrobrachium nipponense TaxID=159736 RepID=UPI0030C8A0B3
MAFYNPTEGLGADLPLSDDDLSAMIGATEDLLRNPAGNERAQANFQRAGQRFFELQESTPSTSSYEYPPPALPAEPLHTQTLYSAATISGEPYPSQQTLMGYHPAASSSDYGGCQGSSSQAMHPGSLKERMEDYAPPNPRKTSRGGFQPSVEKIYDTSEENRLQRRRELGNVACKRHRNRQKETLRNIKAAVMELQNKNDNLRKQKELLGIIRDLYINYMNGC